VILKHYLQCQRVGERRRGERAAGAGGGGASGRDGGGGEGGQRRRLRGENENTPSAEGQVDEEEEEDGDQEDDEEEEEDGDQRIFRLRGEPPFHMGPAASTCAASHMSSTTSITIPWCKLLSPSRPAQGRSNKHSC